MYVFMRIVKCKLAAIITTNNSSLKQQYNNATYKLYLRPSDYEEVAVVHTNMFAKIFGKRKGEIPRKLPIVKISYGNKCIYRRIELVSCDDFCEGIVAMTYKSMGELTNCHYDDKREKKLERIKEGNEVEVRPAYSLNYYWHHPNSATRMSFRIGVPSLMIGVVSLILGLVALL